MKVPKLRISPGTVCRPVSSAPTGSRSLGCPGYYYLNTRINNSVLNPEPERDSSVQGFPRTRESARARQHVAARAGMSVLLWKQLRQPFQ